MRGTVLVILCLCVAAIASAATVSVDHGMGMADSTAAAAVRRSLQEGSPATPLLDCDFTAYTAFLTPLSTKRWYITGQDNGPVFKSCFGVAFRAEVLDIYKNVATGEERRYPYWYSGNVSTGSELYACSSLPYYDVGVRAFSEYADYMNVNLTEYIRTGFPQRPYLPFSLDSICYDTSLSCASQPRATVCAPGSPTAQACPVTCGTCDGNTTPWVLGSTQLGAVPYERIPACCDDTNTCSSWSSEVEWESGPIPPGAVSPPTTPPPSPVDEAAPDLTCQFTSYEAFLAERSTKWVQVEFLSGSQFQSCYGLDFRLQILDTFYNNQTGNTTQVVSIYTGHLATGSINVTCSQAPGPDPIQQYASLLRGNLTQRLQTSNRFENRLDLPFDPTTVCTDQDPGCVLNTPGQVCGGANVTLAALCPVTCGTCAPEQVWQLQSTVVGTVGTVNMTTCCDTNSTCTQDSTVVERVIINAPPEPDFPNLPPTLPSPQQLQSLQSAAGMKPGTRTAHSPTHLPSHLLPPLMPYHPHRPPLPAS